MCAAAVPVHATLLYDWLQAYGGASQGPGVSGLGTLAEGLLQPSAILADVPTIWQLLRWEDAGHYRLLHSSFTSTLCVSVLKLLTLSPAPPHPLQQPFPAVDSTHHVQFSCNACLHNAVKPRHTILAEYQSACCCMQTCPLCSVLIAAHLAPAPSPSCASTSFS